MKENDLIKRTFDFGVNTILFLRTLPDNTELRVIKNQLIKSCTSVGANYEEAQGGSSKADFKNKVNIALKEARETNYWLRLLEALKYDDKILKELIRESIELKHILGAIVFKCRSEEDK